MDRNVPGILRPHVPAFNREVIEGRGYGLPHEIERPPLPNDPDDLEDRREDRLHRLCGEPIHLIPSSPVILKTQAFRQGRSPMSVSGIWITIPLSIESQVNKFGNPSN